MQGERQRMRRQKGARGRGRREEERKEEGGGKRGKKKGERGGEKGERRREREREERGGGGEGGGGGLDSIGFFDVFAMGDSVDSWGTINLTPYYHGARTASQEREGGRDRGGGGGRGEKGRISRVDISEFVTMEARCPGNGAKQSE